MNKKIIIIGVASLAAVAAGILLLGGQPAKTPQETAGTAAPQKENLAVSQDLAPVELSAQDLQAMKSENVEMPSSQDSTSKSLQSVRTSDDIFAIDRDLQETDLSGLDLELSDIEKDLSEI